MQSCVEVLLHLELLELVARIDDQPARPVALRAACSTYCLPNEPVPPVIRMDFSLNMVSEHGPQ